MNSQSLIDAIFGHDEEEEEYYDEDYDGEVYDEEEAFDEECEDNTSTTFEIPIQVTVKGKKQIEKQEQEGQKKKTIKKEETKESSRKIQYLNEDDEWFQQHIYNNETTTDMKQLLKEVNFQLDVSECLNMSLERVDIDTIVEVVNNPDYETKWSELKRNNWNVHHDVLKKQMLYPDGTPIPKLLYKKPNTNVDNWSKKAYWSSVAYGNTIFLYGGVTSKGTPSQDLICWNIEESTVKIMHQDSVVSNDFPKPPALQNHKMVLYGNSIIFIGTNYNNPKKIGRFKSLRRYGGYNTQDVSDGTSTLRFWILQNIENDKEMRWGYNKQPIRLPFHYNEPIEGLKDFIVEVLDDKLYLFGGRRSGSNIATNEMYIIQFDKTTAGIYTYTKAPKKVNQVWPCERFAHASTIYNGKILIFGGTNSKQDLNDMYLFDPSTCTWEEVIMNGITPPPLYFHSITMVNQQYLILYGGCSKLQQPQQHHQYLYRFDMRNLVWSVMKIMGQGEHALFTEETQQLQRIHQVRGHASTLSRERLFILGGQRREQVSSLVYCINHVTDVGNTNSLLWQFLHQKRLENFLCDAVLYALDRDGQLRNIPVHQCIVYCRLPQLLLQDSVQQDAAALLLSQSKEDRVIRFIKELHYEALNALIQFVYTGSIQLSEEGNLKELLEYTKGTPIGDQLEQICNTNRVNLENCNEVLHLLENDLKKLVNNLDSYSDIRLLMPNGETVNSHKLILCRSPYFRSMFASGFMESTAKELEIENVDTETILVVLQFLYSNHVSQVNLNNCMNVLLCSMLFQLSDLANYCRYLVKYNLTIGNVLQVLDIADFYKDLNLKRECISFLKRNWESVKQTNTMFGSLDSDLMAEIEKEYSLYKSKQNAKQKRKK